MFAFTYSLLLKASAIHELIDGAPSEVFDSQSASGHDHQSILQRLDRIEAALGISQEIPEETSTLQELATEEDAESAPLQGVWQAVAHLRSITRPSPDEAIWARPIVKRLWSS